MTANRWTRLASWPARQPRLALLLALIAAMASLAGVWRLSPDASVQSLFPSGDPAAQAMVQVLNHFSAADDLLILATLPASQPTDSTPLLFFADRLDQAVHHSPDASPLVDAVVYRTDEQSKQFFERVLVPAGIYYLNDSAFAAARHRLTKPEMVKQIRQNEAMISAPGPAAGALSAALLQDPLRLHEFLLGELNARKPFKSSGNSDAFLSPDGRSLLIRVVGKKSLGDLEFAKKLTATVSDLTRRANTGGLGIDISGGYAIAAASERAIRHDMIVSVICSILFLQALFIVAYRRPARYFLLAFVPVALGILFGFGVRSLLSPTISPMVAVVGAVLAGLGIDYTVLYLPHYHVARVAGLTPVEAAGRTTMALGSALLAACITSIIGFVAIGWSSVPALRDFSRVGSLGLAGALLAAVWVLPAMLAWLDRGEAPLASGPRVGLAPLLEWISHHRRALMMAMGIVLGGAVAVIFAFPGPVFSLESDLTVMHPRPNAPLDAEAKIARRMGTNPGSLVVYLHAKSSEQLTRLANEVSQRLKRPSVADVGVVGTYGLGTLLPDPDIVTRRRAAITPAQADKIVADFREAIADSSFSESAYELYAQFLKRMLSGPPAPGIADLVPYRRLAETMLSRGEVSGAAPNEWEAITLVFFNRPLEDRASRLAAVDAVRNALADVPGATLTGMSVVGLDTERAIQHDLPKLLLVASVLVAGYLLLHFRSLRSAALALIPAVFSLACLLAFMRLTGQTFNLVNLIALPLLVGIDVDYGIYLVSLAKRKGSEDASAIPVGIGTSAHSVMVSAAANVLGFGSLITTSVPAIRSLGWAVGIGVASCFVGTLFLLAPMLMSDPDLRLVREHQPKEAM
jgi:hypothetical protein